MSVPKRATPHRRNQLLVQVVAEKASDREAISRVVDSEPGIRVVASVKPRHATSAVGQYEPHTVVVLADDEAACRAAQELKSGYPKLHMVIVVSDLEPGDDDSVTSTGCKTPSAAVVMPMLRQIAKNQQPLIKLDEANAWDGVLLAKLTKREKEVLTLTAQGHSIKQIAQKLHRAQGTISRHRENIMGKLHLHDRVALTRFAIRTQLTKP